MKQRPRIGLLDPDTARARGKALGLNEQLATLNVFRTLLHQEPLAKAVAGTLTPFPTQYLAVPLEERVEPWPPDGKVPPRTAR